MNITVDFQSRFWKSCGEVALLSVFTFIPLIFNIILAIIPAIDKSEAITGKIVPGEILAYCLSFIAPLFILIIKVLKTNGTNYKLPFITIVMVISIRVVATG